MIKEEKYIDFIKKDIEDNFLFKSGDLIIKNGFDSYLVFDFELIKHYYNDGRDILTKYGKLNIDNLFKKLQVRYGISTEQELLFVISLIIKRHNILYCIVE